MLSIKTEAAALELIEAELKKSPSLYTNNILLTDYRNAKHRYRQFCKLNVYCSLHPDDITAIERLYKEYDSLTRELSQLTWRVLNGEKPHPFVNVD